MGLDRGANYRYNGNYITIYVIRLTWTPYIYTLLYVKYVSIKKTKKSPQQLKTC